MKKYTSYKKFRIDSTTNNVLKRNVEKRNKATKKKISESEYLRNLIMKDKFEQLTVGIDREAYGNMIRQMAGIGNNINQIAHKMNMNIYDKEDMEILKNSKEELQEIKEMLTEVIVYLKNSDL